MSKSDNQGGFARGVLTLTSGRLIAQIITVGFIPVITRLYGSEEFGQYAVLVSLSIVLLPISTLRFNAAIVIPKSDKSAATLTYLSLLTSFLAAVILTVVLGYWKNELAGLINLDPDTLNIFLPMLVLLGAWQITFEGWSIRHRYFSRVAAGSIVGILLDRIAAITLPLLGLFGVAALLIARSLGRLLNTVMLARRCNFIRGNSGRYFPRLGEMKSTFLRYRKFAIYSPAEVIQQLARQAPTILLGIVFTPATAGLYALTARILAEPIQMVGSSIGRNYAQRIARDSAYDRDISTITLVLFRYLLRFMIGPAVVVVITSPAYFGFIFGEVWSDSGIYLQIVLPVFALNFIVRALTPLFDVLHKQEKQLEFSVYMLIGAIAPFAIAEFFGVGVKVALLLYSLTACLLYIYRIVWFMDVLCLNRWDVLKEIVILFPAIFAMGILAWMALNLFTDHWAILLFSVFMVLLWYIYLLLSDGYLRDKLGLKVFRKA